MYPLDIDRKIYTVIRKNNYCKECNKYLRIIPLFLLSFAVLQANRGSQYTENTM